MSAKRAKMGRFTSKCPELDEQAMFSTAEFRGKNSLVVLQFSFFASPQVKSDFWPDHPCG